MQIYHFPTLRSGIDKRGLMFEREYTAVLLDRHDGKSSRELSLARMDAQMLSSQMMSSQLSLRQLEHAMNSSTSLGGKHVPFPEENKDQDEIYDFVISLIPGGGCMCNYFASRSFYF